MYIPEIYRNTDLKEVRAFLLANSFGILVSQQNGRSLATHIPLEITQNEAGKDILHAHISKENPQWHNFEDGMEVLAVFPGPHSYISSSWYDFEEVPTWNYIAVHIYGKLKMISGKKLYKSLKMLVDKYESHSEHPVRMEDMSAETLRQIEGVVGFEISIDEIHAAKKMSQNRDDGNHENIVRELGKKEDAQTKEVSKLMKKNR